MVKAMYFIVVGVLTALLIGVGVATFYEAPEGSGSDLDAVSLDAADLGSLDSFADIFSAVDDVDGEELEEDFATFAEEEREYERNVVITLLVVSTLVMMFAFVFFRNAAAIAGGLMLGAVLNLLHAVLRATSVADEVAVLLVTGGVLLVALVVGYWYFVDNKFFQKLNASNK